VDLDVCCRGREREGRGMLPAPVFTGTLALSLLPHRAPPHLPLSLSPYQGLNVRIGRAIVDWVHVNNLVSAMLLAHSKLASINGRADQAPAGRAYFISDNDPVGAKNEIFRFRAKAHSRPKTLNPKHLTSKP